MLKFYDIIPTKHSVHRGESLNILGIVENNGEDTHATISVWGRESENWVLLVSKEIYIVTGEHKHVYFTIDRNLFSEGFWGEEPEEIEICLSDKKPDKLQSGVLIVIV